MAGTGVGTAVVMSVRGNLNCNMAFVLVLPVGGERTKVQDLAQAAMSRLELGRYMI